MIKRYFKDGDKLDVSGLNEITVLLDRSETESTEIGWNCWTPQQDGPPHKHNDKDQVFYVTGGVGIIKLGDNEYHAHEGCLAYVPAGLVHQTITTTEEKLCYMLFNVFKSENKEGHGTFAEHIEKVKAIRKRQAETGVTEVDDEEQLTDLKDHKFYPVLQNGTIFNSGSENEAILLERHETNKFELTLINSPEGTKVPAVSHEDMELSVFILRGEGNITLDNESDSVKPGDLIYIPRKSSFSIEALKGDLRYICLKALKEKVGE